LAAAGPAVRHPGGRKPYIARMTRLGTYTPSLMACLFERL
jgi:hypothetical protein